MEEKKIFFDCVQATGIEAFLREGKQVACEKLEKAQRRNISVFFVGMLAGALVMLWVLYPALVL